MSIKPVDMQVMIPKTNEIAKNQNDGLQRNAALQQHQAGVVEHKAQERVKQVYSQETPQHLKLGEREGRGGSGAYKRDGSKEKKPGSGEAAGDADIGTSGRIDIRI